MRSRARVLWLMVVCGLVLAVVLPVAAQAAPIGIEKLLATNCTEEECGEETVLADSGAPFHFEFREPKKEITVK
jgi:hypothetical protein